jgi:hypothetical protein
MKVLLDENVPVALLTVTQKLLEPQHEVEHVCALGWAGKPDVSVLRDARTRRYDVLLTNDLQQYQNPEECDAIRRSGLHHVTYRLPEDGLDGLALACAAICAAVRGLIAELATAPGQRIGAVTSLPRDREAYTITNPGTRPPSPYWR